MIQDSYTQNGFAFDLNGALPSENNPTGHPAIGSQTFTLGPNYVEYLTTQFNNTEVFDYDFGWGGATINDSIIPPSDPDIQSFQQQVTSLFEPMFSSQDGGQVPWTGANSIFSIFFGINDLTHACPDADTQTALLDSYFSLCDNLYGVGARNFLFIGVPPVDRSPLGCNTNACDTPTCSNIINEFNYALATRVQPWASVYSDVKTSIYDFHAYMTDVLDNPATYGFDNAICAGDGDQHCVWQNQSSIHTGYTFNKLYAQNMTSSLEALGW